ncbi:MAG: Quinohemoprotein alcohol dehydrogenase ADH IIB [Pseudomonadales bacterium]|nr:Quinohemoprotein alcohol dehydrogenase ADH IIB [Pseudomonadales bacterium]
MAAADAGRVDDARLRTADEDPANWITHGRTWGEQRFSPLAQIDASNVGRLDLAWSQALEHERGVQTTPLVVDGVLYATGSWSVVYAFDAARGTALWKYDPQVDRVRAAEGCCGPVNRGVAVWGGMVYVGTLDGRLIALDAANGTPRWSADTFIDAAPGRNITGAPRVVKGRVLIGNGGADMGARGYVSAYDARSGELAWRFFTVPGNPALGFENATLAKAAMTWSGEEWWRWGGGGTVWDAMSYDPELDLLYIGVGNSSLFPRARRSPGGGDNLFVSSIVALRPDDGRYVWHFQLAPGEQWDYPATTQLVLIDTVFQGEQRKLLVQVPKHGFVYVLDRENGQLLSAEKFTRVTWASHYDLASGRPVENPEADYSRSGKPTLVWPGALGGHNWNPVSWNPRTGLLYFSETRMPSVFAMDPQVQLRERGRRYNTSLDMSAMLNNPAFMAEQANPRGSLIAWDVARARIAWQVEQPLPINGGTLSTAGNLVFHGATDGRLVAYRADSGEQLWEARTFGAVQGGPVSYAVDGRQYIAAGIGWGGGHSAALADGATLGGWRNASRIGVWTLDGQGVLPEPERFTGAIAAIPVTADEATLQRGVGLFMTHCGYCHGAGSGGVPDLNYMSKDTHARFEAIVRGGLLAARGMPAFAEQLSREEAEAIRQFLAARAAHAAAVR